MRRWWAWTRILLLEESGVLILILMNMFPCLFPCIKMKKKLFETMVMGSTIFCLREPLNNL